MLLKTKTYMPKEKSNAVIRRSLLDRLQADGNAGLILVSAPAGFGKTTLVAQWLAAQRNPAAWYAIDETDNEPNLFFRYLLSALEQLDEALKGAFAPLLGSGRLPPAKRLMALVLKRLALLSRDSFLVLDDYHYIESDQIHESVHYFLANLPPRLRVVISTRHDPRFSLDRFRSRGQMIAIRSEELRFSLAEAALYFRALESVRLDAAQAEHLYHKTEGWIAGLQLAGISLLAMGDADRFIHEFDGKNQFVVDYFMEETFQGLSGPVRQFLVRTSVLRGLSGDLCRSVTGIPSAPDLLLEVERSNLFLVPLDQEGQWFRYHHLFAELLRGRLDREAGPPAEALHKRASRWHAAQGSLQEALHHAFASKDFEFAADLLEKRGNFLIGNYQVAIAESWLGAVPEEIFRRRPMLQIQAVWVKALQERMEEVAPLVAELSVSLSQPGEGEKGTALRQVEDLLAAFRVYSLWVCQDNGQVIREAPGALAALSEESVLARGLIRLAHAFSLFDRGDILKAAAPLEEALREMLSENASYGVTSIFRYQSWLERLQGRLQSALAMVRKSLAWMDASEFSTLPSAIELYSEAAEVLYEINDLEGALCQVDSCLEYAELTKGVASLPMAFMGKAFILQAMGRSCEAERMMERAAEAAGRSKSPLKIALIHAGAANLALRQGNLAPAQRWEANRALHPDEPFCRVFEYECLAQARLHLSRRQFRDAQALLVRLLRCSESRQRLEAVMQIRILLAGALFGCNEREGALSLLTQALEFGGPEGYVRSFADNAAYIAEPLILLGRRRKVRGPRYLADLLAACDIEGAPCRQGENLWLADGERLTPSEVRILRLIAAGNSNRQIARTTSVSLNTVKTHIRHLYGKLGVDTRARAVVRAGELLSCRE